MTYERQEQAFDPIAIREREDERADYVSETWAEMARQDAMQRPPCIGNDPSCPCQDGDMCHYRGPNAWPVHSSIPELPEIGNHIEINSAWMAGTLTGRMVKRSLFPHIAACDAEEQMADRFETRPSRIQISRITLSEGGTK